jgi:hypothetical protein
MPDRRPRCPIGFLLGEMLNAVLHYAYVRLQKTSTVATYVVYRLRDSGACCIYLLGDVSKFDPIKTLWQYKVYVDTSN